MQLNDQLVALPNLHQVIDRYPLTISPDSHVLDAIILMNQEQNKSVEIVNASESLPVSKGREKASGYILVVQKTQLLGIFTLRDVLRLTALGKDLSKTRIAEVMTQQLITLKESDFQDISTVLSILQQHEIHHLPIVDNGEKLVGIVTESALLEELDLVGIVSVVKSVQNYFQESQKSTTTSDECQDTNQQIKEVDRKTDKDNILHRLLVERTAELVVVNQALQQEIQERQQTEAALRKSEGIFRQFGENIQTQIIWIKSYNNGETVYVNPAYEKIWGRSCQSLWENPQSWMEAIHPEDRDDILAKIEERHQKGEGVSLEYRIVQPNGAIRWIWSRCFPIKNEQGQLDYYGSITEDITEPKLADQSLRESEARLTLALEAINMGIWDWDFGTDEKLWSPNMGLLYGLPSGTVCPSIDNFLNLIHPQDRELFVQGVKLAIEQKSEFSVEYRAVWPDGSLHWLSTRGKVYYDEQSQPIRMIGTTKDISDRKEKEHKIYEQAALLDIATDAIFVRDFQTEILFWNQGAERIYGWTKDEAVGKNLKDLFCPKTALQQEAAALKAVLKLGTWQGELRKQSKSGQEIIVESRWTLMFDADGQPKSILIVDTDITEKKQLEEQFFRTQRLESIGTLAGGITHDLNNILTPISVAAQLLKGRFAKDQERHPHLLTIIENNAVRGAALVKQILSFARGLKGERTIVQVKHLITEIIQIAKQTFPKSIEFSAQIPEDLWTVSGDSTQLHQVLMNLVLNARDAMPEGGLLTISAENRFIDEVYTQMHLEANVGDYIVISVTDTGMGMCPEILERIFEPFFTTKEVGAGTGLGLSTAAFIIKSHNGFVTVSSQVGKGSTFKIFLPSVEAHQLPSLEQLEILPGTGELILVVDDEPQIRDVAKIILENHNYRTLTASNGIEAIALYAQNKQQISAVLMDMIMPEMDGVTAIYTLQKMNPEVQVIACSGLGTIELLPQSAETKVQAVLLKPYTANDLLKNLNQVIRNS
ncbi:MAG: hypothetical protein RLZZ507_2540 [Cyanobacteriota bacterium]|jgi:PAS domain S-box-containing protein